ncbi:sigma factor [Streptomyces sp. NPDC001450]
MGADTATDVFEEHRPFLMGVAYRMLGRVADAEGVVQDARLRRSRADREEVRGPRAHLVRVITDTADPRPARRHRIPRRQPAGRPRRHVEERRPRQGCARPVQPPRRGQRRARDAHPFGGQARHRLPGGRRRRRITTVYVVRNPDKLRSLACH